MTTLEIIRELCEKNGISISALEKELGYGNGSLSKAAKIPFDRIYDISKRFSKPMEYFMNGEETTNSDTIKDDDERRLLMLCRNAADADPSAKKALVDNFESTIEIYLKAKGIK